MEVLAEVNDGDILTISKIGRNKWSIPSYDCIAGNMEYQTRVPCYPNLYTVIQDMHKRTAWLWWEFVKTRNRYTNEVNYTAKSRVDKGRLTVAYKDLFQLKLVRRISRKNYLINPSAYLPEHGQFQTVKDKWEALP